ncbi:S41 family peptidase [Pedobacter sp. KR3-3]|uniref:S41 family peptidase n=1 Tax=Pedobacter albus TaxID=3113905 RepID=A0ABU7I301_9SPHI|nr:S41 family peptidase [Pedobacter sp. KR3-3]MEE1943847.1 S41 family peptidase [Pedobacter sp. KR3-3]
MKLKPLFILALLAVIFASSCKKTKVTPTPTPVTPTPEQPPVTPTVSRADLTRDSIFLYAKQIYLWSDALPTYEVFNPRKYTSGSSDLANYNSELYAITQLKINPSTGKPYEASSSSGSSKYSYIQDITTKNPTAFVQTEKSSVDLEGNGNDLGVKLGAYGTSSSTDAFALFITAVYQNSPADKAGMVRSDRVTKINGRSIGSSFASDVDFINTAFNGTTITLEGTKYVDGVAGAAFTVSLTKAVYKSSPIYATKVFTAGSKKVGYLAYARFSSMANSQAAFDAAFSNFNTNGVTDLVIDLRYNGGGYVNTAQYLIDQIAPSSANGQMMFAEYYNSLMQSGQATILSNQPLLDGNGKVQYQNGKIVTYANVSYTVANNTEKFNKTGPLQNVKNIVFIVSGNTASASELVINSLKPYMTVTLVGTKTYGKPVGFFPVTIENRYDVYFSLFQSKNSLGQGDYFDGFTPDIVDTYDDPLRNFGDPKENYLAKALNSIAPSVTVTAKANISMSIQGQKVSAQSLSPMRPLVDGNEFVGMIETKHTLKK